MMTPEQFAEIKTRDYADNSDNERPFLTTIEIIHRGRQAGLDRAALIAEVERLRGESDHQIDEVASALVALQSAPRPQPGSAGYRRWCQWYDGARAEALK